MEDPEVIVGQIKQKVGDAKEGWRCTPENARESLLKHGYASSPNRDWRVADRGYNEDQVW